MKITYRNGYPSRKCIDNLIEEYFKNIKGYFPFMTYSVGITGRINWQRELINEHIDSFVLFLNENGIKTDDYSLYRSPRTGDIKFTKR